MSGDADGLLFGCREGKFVGKIGAFDGSKVGRRDGLL